MARGDRKTPLTSWVEPFPTTRWTDILNVRSGDEQQRDAVLSELLARYWKPVYCYLRCKGHRDEEAKDLTQGFFHKIVLRRHLVRQAERLKGRFRTFLLTALDRYAADIHRAETAKQRVPGGGLVRARNMDSLRVTEPVHYAAPDAAFDYAWASGLLDEVLAEVAGECRRTGKAAHWDVFRARVLEPVMNDAQPPPLNQLCKEYGISNVATASNMIITVKRRFRDVLRRHVREFVDSDAKVDKEIRDLLGILSVDGAGL